MQLTNLFDENDGSRAVSPVIGVILMVAITVILAAVIGTFVLGLGDSVESAPQASMDFEIDDTNNNVDVSHRGGDNILLDNLEFRVGGTAVGLATAPSTGDELKVGETVSADVKGNASGSGISGFPGDANGATLDVVYTEGERGTIIASFDIPTGSFTA